MASAEKSYEWNLIHDHKYVKMITKYPLPEMLLKRDHLIPAMRKDMGVCRTVPVFLPER